MPLALNSELPVTGTTIVIYGKPDVGKTTLAFTAKNPLIIDFDKLAYKANLKGQIWEVNTWQDALDLLDAEELNMFDTIVIDTVSTAQDYLQDFLAKESPKLASRIGPTMAGWGRMKTDFVDLVKAFNRKNKNVVVLAHEDLRQENEVYIYQPKVKGGFLNFITETVPVIGHFYAEGKNRVLDFTFDEKHTTKGEKLGKIINPTDLQQILDEYREVLKSGQLKNTKALDAVREFSQKIKDCKNAGEVNALVISMKDLDKAIKIQLMKGFNSKVEELKLKKEDDVYIDNVESETKTE